MIWNFVVGGVAGWLLAKFMNAGGDEVDKDNITPGVAIEVLVKDIRNEAQGAMDECATDEEREIVYAQVKESVQKIQFALQEKGKEIIADLRAQVADAQGGEDTADAMESRVQEFKKKMDKLSDTLNQTLSDLKPASAEA